MKIRFSYVVLLFVLSSVSFFSCKDDKEDDPIPAPVNVLCDGKGSLSYMPLALGNRWLLTAGSDSIQQGVYFVTTAGTVQNFEVGQDAANTITYSRLANGNITIVDMNGDDVLYMPAVPVPGQTWAYEVGFATERRVVNLNSAIYTPKCAYTNCLKIEDISGSSVVATSYYKKGVGMVSSDFITGNPNYKLAGIILN